MSLTSLYEDFLRAPNAAALADKASLHYITTLTSIHDAPKVIKQLTAQHLRKREEKIIDAVEGQDSIALEVATTIEFLIGGGAYLPGLDDNFLADRIVNLPMVRTPVRFQGTPARDPLTMLRPILSISTQVRESSRSVSPGTKAASSRIWK